MSLISCNVVLLPSTKLANEAVTLSKRLEKYGTLYTLNDAGPFPHVSLYMTQLREETLGQVEELLAHIAGDFRAMSLQSIHYGQAEGYIDAEYARSPQLNELQMRVVNALNPIRDGLREKDRVRMADATGVVRANLERYGYRSIGELFRPHISFTRFADGGSIATNDLLPYQTFTGDFGVLGLFEMGDNGTCIRHLASFPLSA